MERASEEAEVARDEQRTAAPSSPGKAEARIEAAEVNSAAARQDFVWAIVFDQDCFGLHWTEEGARADLERQISEGGPAWEDCKIVRWHVDD